MAGSISAAAGPKLATQGFYKGLAGSMSVGGAASVAGGGKFWNGAKTAAYGYLFNEGFEQFAAWTSGAEGLAAKQQLENYMLDNAGDVTFYLGGEFDALYVAGYSVSGGIFINVHRYEMGLYGAKGSGYGYASGLAAVGGMMAGSMNGKGGAYTVGGWYEGITAAATETVGSDGQFNGLALSVGVGAKSYSAVIQDTHTCIISKINIGC